MSRCIECIGEEVILVPELCKSTHGSIQTSILYHHRDNISITIPSSYWIWYLRQQSSVKIELPEPWFCVWFLGIDKTWKQTAAVFVHTQRTRPDKPIKLTSYLVFISQITYRIGLIRVGLLYLVTCHMLTLTISTIPSQLGFEILVCPNPKTRTFSNSKPGFKWPPKPEFSGLVFFHCVILSLFVSVCEWIN